MEVTFRVRLCNGSHIFPVPINMLLESPNGEWRLLLYLEEYLHQIKKIWYHGDHLRKIQIIYLQEFWTDENFWIIS